MNTTKNSSGTKRVIAALTLISVTMTGLGAPVSIASAGEVAFNPQLVAPVNPMLPGDPGNFAPGGGGGGGGATPEQTDEPVAGGGKPEKGKNGELLAAGLIGLAAGAILTGAMNQNAQPAAATQLPGWWIAECARRYNTYNPDDNTYLGLDGYRHACDPR